MKIHGKRTTGLVASVVLAALASLALISYMNGVESRAFAGAETLEVWVASADIPAGTSAEQAKANGQLATTRLPRKALATGAIGSLAQIAGKVAAVNIVRGEQILTSRFVERGTGGAGLVIPKGRQAMSLEVESPPGVAGFVHAGSHINVLAHVDIVGANGSAVEPQTQFVIQNIEVLAVGTRVVEAADDGARAEAGRQQELSDSVLLTLAVTPNEAEKLGFAILEGEIYITLLPDDAAPAKTSGRNRRNEFR